MQIVSRENQIKTLIRRKYARGQADGYARALRAGYSEQSLSRAPHAVVERWSGCGNLAERVMLDGAEIVADLGCGSGLDVWLIANSPRPPSAVFALDLTPEALAGLPGQLRAMAGDMEMLPLAASSCDLVIANASFNLALDQNKAFSEAARILKQSGRLYIFDLVREDGLPGELLSDPMGHGASLGGVMCERDLRATIEAAGFSCVEIRGHKPFGPVIAVEIEARVR